MPEFVDLAYTEEELAERKEDACCAMPSDYKGPKYPWGLEVELRSEALEKMGKSINDFTIGETIEVPVKLKVTRLSANETEDGGKQETAGFVLTHIYRAEGNPGERARKLYPEQGDAEQE